MSKRVVVVCRDDYMYQKIYLALRNKITVERADTAGDDADTVYILDCADEAKAKGSKIVLGEDIPLPFSYTELEESIEKTEAKETKILTRGNRCAYLRGEKIPLTEVELSLLSALMDANGEYVSRDSLMQSVWQGEADSGVLNVYIHYLRNKLERGEKIILSSRSFGYKIDGRYL